MRWVRGVSWLPIFLASFWAGQWSGDQRPWLAVEWFEGTQPGDYVLCGHSDRLLFGGWREGGSDDYRDHHAVWWDTTKIPHLVADGDHFAADDRTYQLITALWLDPRAGALTCQAVCMEWLDWRDLYADDPDAPPWDGPRFALVEVLDGRWRTRRSADFDGDGAVDTRDLVAFVGAWSAER